MFDQPYIQKVNSESTFSSFQWCDEHENDVNIFLSELERMNDGTMIVYYNKWSHDDVTEDVWSQIFKRW